MKHFLTLVVAVLVAAVFCATAIAGQATVVNQQTSMRPSAQTTLLNTAPTSTAAANSNYATFDYPMNNLSCDFVVGPGSGTSNNAFTVVANQGSSTTLFDSASNFGLASFNLASSATLTVIATKNVFTGKPFRTIQATYTPAYTGANITINCSATQ